MISVGPNSEKV